MAKYLTRLWDDYSKIVLTNTRDIDSRDEQYPEVIASKVWSTVDALRTKRITFLRLFREEEARRKRKLPSNPPR